CADASSSSAQTSKAATTSRPARAPIVQKKPPADPEPSVVATAVVAGVEVFASPDDTTPDHVLANPTKDGGQLVFLVEERRPGWVKVFLPVRPNGSTGWVGQESVRLSRHAYRVEVRRGAHRLVVFEGADIVLDVPVGIGTSQTPTPGGMFYITELIESLDPAGPYGPYAFGLSGFSDQLDSFNGGEGAIGIHGTSDPSTVGADVSHGCIRMTNDAITSLVGLLPLGTPVRILA
ncbi:MAG: L,D-transpeptidase, partial [Actinobacteria bacterium]|nr:L,D-transpeptidase [Actinomycetota bacterium]